MIDQAEHNVKTLIISQLNSPDHHQSHSSPSEHHPSFQKNYPKNIFIPIIQYLTQIGLQDKCQKCVGRREELEGKNVVSLGMIHHLLSQSWFIERVDSKVLLCNVCNKIMMNSKIKKKYFHLRVAEMIVNLKAMEQKQFKKKVSKSSNLIAIQCGRMHDELFQAPNSLIYLLRLFLKVLNHTRPLDYSSNKKQISSKEEYKFLVKEISGIINRKILSSQWINTYQQIKKQILQREQDLQIKFNLPEGVPNWNLFVICVVDRCFEYKKIQAKLTNSIINDWVSDFRNKLTTVRFLIVQHKWYGAKVFQPIIIQPPQI